ncbi:TetR/AcrR family transcriptional regulator [Nesterenkonia alkaliphila]|uniref:TetR/AcrR family transcriptional regulator n=1 Tax=Nesterenkonia alkaliphila TaxID=1463631 RepID=UPI0019A816BA|nr:TetR/AcrR family transcriptional regulator [Nesterenkonia alkaliphila]GFZ91429.1 TetR family transcriptional regulator [Nesterenkonia alkaliphila]
MSYWEHRKPVRRARAVDVEQVAQAGVQLLDEGGLRALTIRAVAQRLGVAAASLYSRVSSVDDLYDLALDYALSTDQGLQRAIEGAGLHQLMMAFYRHLVAHPWACQVIAMRAPRGPNYLRLSERMCVLLADQGAADPLGAAYTLSNFVIGSATTTPMARNERTAPIDADIAPEYAALHAEHEVEAASLVSNGLKALLG